MINMIKVEETQIRARLKERLSESTITLNYNNCNRKNPCFQLAHRLVYLMNPDGIIYMFNKIFMSIYGKPASLDTIRRVKKLINSPIVLKFVPITLILRTKSYFIRY